MEPDFRFDEPDLGGGVVLTTEPQVLAVLPRFDCLRPADRVWLTSSVGWQATQGIPVVVLFIDRLIDGISTLAYAIQDSREANFDRWGDSSLNHVDIGQIGSVTYRLLASLGYDQETDTPFGLASVYQATLTGLHFDH